MPEKVVFLLDGGFVKKKLEEKNGHFPTVKEIAAIPATLMQHPRLAGKDMFRIYFYDAPPFLGKSKNPISRAVLDFSSHPKAAQNKSLLDALEFEPDFAVRRGVLMCSGWKLGRAAIQSLGRQPRPVTATDFVPDLVQKGVDIRIGLDIAWIALRGVAHILVLVTGDSDFVPVMKFARKEGVRVYLEELDHPVRPELKAHADFVF